MGKYSFASRQTSRPRREVHPVMRGIGCIMIILVPLLAFGSAVLLVNYGAAHGWPIPPGWLGAPTFHPLLWQLARTSVPIATILNFFQAQNNLTANLVFAIAIILAFIIIQNINGKRKKIQLQKDQIEGQRATLEMAYDELKSTQVQLIQKEKMASLGELAAGIVGSAPHNFCRSAAPLRKSARPGRTQGEWLQEEDIQLVAASWPS